MYQLMIDYTHTTIHTITSVHTKGLLSMHTGTVPVQFPWSHILVVFPSSLNPPSQVYVATVPFGLVPLNGKSMKISVPLSI